MIDLSLLNENQREAVLWRDGPFLTLAGIFRGIFRD